MASTYLSSSPRVLEDNCLVGFAHEVLIVGFFVVSLLTWRRLLQKKLPIQRNSKSRQARAESVPSRPWVDISATPASQPAAPARQRHAHAEPASGGSDARAAVAATERQMQALLDTREFSRALGLYRRLDREHRVQFLSESFLTGFVSTAVRVGKQDVLTGLIRSLLQSGCGPSLDLWQMIFRMLCSRTQHAYCVEIFSLFEADIPQDKIIFSCIINAALDAGMPELAARILPAFRATDIDSKDYILFFRVYTALGDVDTMVELLFELGARGIERSSLMLNLCLRTYIDSNDPERAYACLSAVRGSATAAMLVDVVSFNIVLKGFAQVNSLERCVQCLRDMKDSGVEPDDITFSTLSESAKENCKRPARVDQFAKDLPFLDKPIVSRTFVKCMLRMGCLTEALLIYEQVKRDHFDAATSSMLIKCLVDQQDLDRALQIVNDMRAGGHHMDDIILTHLLEGCRRADKMSLAEELFREAIVTGLQPSLYVLTTLLKIYGRNGAHEKSCNLLVRWEAEHGNKPSVIHYTCVIGACLRSKYQAQAWKTYDLMREALISPDETTITTLLPTAVEGKLWDRAFELVKFAISLRRLKVPHHMLRDALSQMLQVASPDSARAAELQVLMESLGC